MKRPDKTLTLKNLSQDEAEFFGAECFRHQRRFDRSHGLICTSWEILNPHEDIDGIGCVDLRLEFKGLSDEEMITRPYDAESA